MDKEKKSPNRNGEAQTVYMPEHAKLGLYSNIANVGITNNEVTIIFMQKDRSGITAVSKIILPISHAQSLVDALSKGLKKIKSQDK